MSIRKSIIFYLNGDEIFTFPLAYYLIKKLSLKYNIFIKLGKTSIRKKIKIILIILLDGSIKNLNYFYKKRISINKLLLNKNVKIERNNDTDYEFGLSINYPTKIINSKTDIYNFHFGNFKFQRGSFIFFYKYVYKWTSIDLSFHKIIQKLDSGIILNKRTISVKKMDALNMISIPLKNKDFYFKSVKKIKKKIKRSKIQIGPLNKEPSFFKIFKTKFI